MVKMNSDTDADCIFEKKKWISITGLCNNNCRFCLDGSRPDRAHRDFVSIREEIKEAYDKGCTRLVLSGGDPTIHPDIIPIVRSARAAGFDRIQIITNGRMFSSKEFADKMICAGVSEVTFSIHGADKDSHDALTRVNGSFRQVLEGVRNVRSHDIIINTDTCITKLNYKTLPEIIKFIVEVVGIHEVNLMSMVPQGNAWKNKEEIMYDFAAVAPYVKKVIDYCKKNGAVLWLSRFPGQYLDGYEDYIENPYKMVDDVRGARAIFEDDVPLCKGERCRFCGISSICPEIVSIRTAPRRAEPERFIITEANYRHLPDGDIIIKYPDPKPRLNDSELISFRKLKPYLDRLKRSRFEDIPPCIVDADRIVKRLPSLKDEYLTCGKIDYVKVAKDLSSRAKMKGIRCLGCKEDCEGVFIQYVRKFGFDL